MKKTIRLFVITMMIVMLGMSSLAEARKGQTSSDTETSQSKSSSYSKPSKSSKRSQSSAFGNAAKTNQAKTAWQEYLKKNAEPEPTPVSLEKTPSKNLEQELADLKDQLKTTKKRKKADKLAKQLAALEKQIAESRRQQQLIAIAQTAAQALLNKPRQPGATTSLPRPNQTPPTPAKTEASESGGSWGWILLIVGGVVVIWLWRSKGNSNTIYRI